MAYLFMKVYNVLWPPLILNMSFIFVAYKHLSGQFKMSDGQE